MYLEKYNINYYNFKFQTLKIYISRNVFQIASFFTNRREIHFIIFLKPHQLYTLLQCYVNI